MLISCILLFNKAKNYERFRQELLTWKEITYLSKDKQGRVIALSLPEEDESQIQEKVFDQIAIEKKNIFVTQGQVTPKWEVWFGQKSNSTELLCPQWGLLLPWTPGFWFNLPQNIMHPFPIPTDATHKIWFKIGQLASRDIQVRKCKIFVIQGQVTPIGLKRYSSSKV